MWLKREMILSMKHIEIFPRSGISTFLKAVWRLPDYIYLYLPIDMWCSILDFYTIYLLFITCDNQNIGQLAACSVSLKQLVFTLLSSRVLSWLFGGVNVVHECICPFFSVVSFCPVSCLFLFWTLTCILISHISRMHRLGF